jgi:hypothetical protein
LIILSRLTLPSATPEFQGMEAVEDSGPGTMAGAGFPEGKDGRSC